MKFFPESASTIAPQSDAIFFALIALSAVVLLIIFGPMLYFLVKYRRTNRVNRKMPKLPTMAMEVTWTVIPMILMMGLYAWASEVYFKEERPPLHAMEIDVVGKQWMWKVEHGEGNAEINELHVPVGQAVKLTLASQDVIHSFFIPAFRIKQDVVPGRYTSEWFEATKPGIYHIFCSQYCGTSHAQMVGEVVAMEPAAYQRWLTEKSPGSTQAERGARLFRELGCSGCHMGSTVVRAPRLEGVYGKPVPLQNGEVAVADDAYLRDCILMPAARVPGGYAPLMPSFQGRVTEDELFALLAYIKSLANVKVEGGQP
ncbi:MAG TPA: cytochrome c oxidase subunit II [Verrucomicrobiae bacterium]|nr:cytochrome c oxidase subunit II [Verrucomicrobiae bacterium]